MKCARCPAQGDHFLLVLWTGPNGFRRYPLCPKCVADITNEKKAQLKRILDTPSKQVVNTQK